MRKANYNLAVVKSYAVTKKMADNDNNKCTNKKNEAAATKK